MRHGVEQLATKSSPTDVVTAADKAVEAAAGRRRSPRPARTTGCSARRAARAEGSSGLRWVVDPIDGTVNYLYGIPQWAVSIGVEDGDGTVVGVVYDPSKDELWQAVRGAGATLNGRPLRCTSVTDSAQALVGTGFGYDARRRAGRPRLLPDAAAGGPGHPAARARVRSTCAPWPPAGWTPTTSRGCRPGTCRPAG